MATYYFRNTGSTSFNTETNWSLTDGGPSAGVVPGASDIATFTSNSGDCILDVASKTLAGLNFVNNSYIGTFTFTNGLTVAGNVTLASGMTISGTGELIVSATATLTSNGKTWPNQLRLIGSSSPIQTFVGNWINNGLVSTNAITGQLKQTTTETLTCNGGLSVLSGTGVTGNLPIVLNGGTWSGSNSISLPIIITNDITISGNVTINNNSLTLSNGNITFTANASITISGNVSIDLKNATIPTVSFVNVNGTINLVSDLKIKNLVSTQSTSASHNTIKSSVAGTRRKLTAYSVDLSFVNFTDIDASGGTTIRTYKGVISNCINIVLMTPPTQKGKTFLN